MEKHGSHLEQINVALFQRTEVYGKWMHLSLLLDDVVEKMLQKQEQHAGGKANG